MWQMSPNGVLRVRHSDMRNRVVIVHAAMLVLVGCVSPGPTSTVAITENGYALIWQDEFNEDGAPNPDHWGYETGFVRNEELQWYQAEKTYCSDGKLIVEAKREQKPNPTYVPNSEYWQASRRSIRFTSASLTTSGLLAWQYGRFEVRAKIATENSLWPVVWFMGEDGLWPAGGEIDLMEFCDGNVFANVA